MMCRSLITQRESLIAESTLAGHGAISLMAWAKRAGYRTLLIYVALGEPELHIDRVRLRVAQGGHDIPCNGSQSLPA
jgi:predicted ABC-type ATPase